MAKDLAAFGADQALLDRYLERELEVMVHPDNWEAVRLYLACQTQWRTAAPHGVRTGLDYAAVDVVMRRRGCDDAVFEQLQAIEREMLRWWRDHP